MAQFEFSVLQDPDNWGLRPIKYAAPALLRDGSILYYMFDAAEDADLAREQFVREMGNIGVVNDRSH